VEIAHFRKILLIKLNYKKIVLIHFLCVKTNKINKNTNCIDTFFQQIDIDVPHLKKIQYISKIIYNNL